MFPMEQRILGQTIIKSVKVARIKIKSRANEMAFPVKVFDTTKPDRLEFSSWGPHGRRREPVPANCSPPVLCPTRAWASTHTQTNKEI